jgi:membrane-bound transcription factor site-1 protease
VAARAAAAAAAAFRDAHPQRRLTRHLAALLDDDDSVMEGAAAPEEEVDPQALTPPPRGGRRQTRPTLGMEPPGWHSESGSPASDIAAAAASGRNHSAAAGRRLQQLGGRGVAEALGAKTLWDKGFRGEGIRMGVFDTGVRADHPHFKRIRERSNWTAEKSLDDGLGHGTFVAGVIMGTDPGCPGFAPEAELYTFRVFTNAQLSYTSWFLDAFNYAIARKMHVINLSIGGPDYLDAPFVEKIWEVTGNGIVMVSAIGNDGPLWGTLNNPADQMDVLAVGGIGFDDEMAAFSSRGMTTGELPRGMGRFKPDVVAPGRDVLGSKIQGGCRPLSGTSVSSPVAAGAVVLLASTVPRKERRLKVNPGSMKQAMIEGAKRLRGPNVFEQGAGKIDLLRSADILKAYTPRASAVPASLDLTECADGYMWPFCAQPLYAGAQALIVNVTLLNGMGVTGWLAGPPVFAPRAGGGGLGRHLKVSFTHSERLWPWSGFLGVFVRVAASGADASGIAEGTITLTVVSPPSASRDPAAAAASAGADGLLRSEVVIPLRVRLVQPPPRHMRVLWSVWHNVPYPPAYIPRDNLDMKQDILDWHGDHPATNFHTAYDALRAAGYFVELLSAPITCFDAADYGTLLLIDAEEEYAPAEIAKLEADVKERGLSVVIFGEWYHVPTMVGMRFFDDNTHSYWTPPVGGANAPALNELLAPFGAAFGDRVLKGSVSVGSGNAPYASGANIARLPAGATAHVAKLTDATGSNAAWGNAASGVAGGGTGAAFLGLIQAKGDKAGRVVLFGDSNCLDSSHASGGDCFWLLPKLLRYAAENVKDADLFPSSALLSKPLATPEPLPLRRTDTDFTAASKVMGGKRLVCGAGDVGADETAQAEASKEAEKATDEDAQPKLATAVTDAALPPAPEAAGDPPAMVVPILKKSKSPPPTRRSPPPAPKGVDAFALSRGAAEQGRGAGAGVGAGVTTPELLHWAPMILGPLGLGVLAFWLQGTRRRSREAREAAAAASHASALPRLRYGAAPGARSTTD